MFKEILLGSFIFIGSVSNLFASKMQEDGDAGKKRNALTTADFPADMERNYDALLENWATKTQALPDCTYETSDPVLFSDSEYTQRLYALPSQMELAFNPIVKQFIEMYANRRRGQVSYMLGQGQYYFPMFEEELDKQGLPLELKYLPVIESALNPVARSRVGASGLWQFMSATGKLYKLEINSLVDERLDPHKSTQAAVKYLKDMYEIYKDWNLVIAAYNCGPGNVNKAIRRSGGKRDYWEIYPYLPKETRGYVPAFIAATYIMSYHTDHNICIRQSELPTLIDTLNINKLVHFEQISDMLNIPVEDIRKLNPQFRADIIPGEYKSYALKLPISQLSAFIAKEDTIYNHRAEELLTHKRTRDIASLGNASAAGGGGYATHKVRRGETLGAIAMRYRVSVSQLKNWNGMRSDRLNIGQNLKVSAYIAPKKEATKASPSQVKQDKITDFFVDNGVLKKTTTVTKKTTTNYQVKKGDSWANIAKNTGASIADIKQWNNIRNNKLVAGRNLKIHKTEVREELTEVAKPQNVTMGLATDAQAYFDTYVDGLDLPTPTATLGILGSEGDATKEFEDNASILEQALAIYHNVIYGETLSQIAERYNVTVEDILSWNNITEASSTNIAKLLIILPQDEESKNNV